MGPRRRSRRRRSLPVPAVTRPGATAEEIRSSVCGDKVRHADPGSARAHAQRLNREAGSTAFGSYRCPFPDELGRHWHAGHVPSLESLEALARVMRGLDLSDPVPHDPPARARRRRRKENPPMADTSTALVPLEAQEDDAVHLVDSTDPATELDLVRWLRASITAADNRRRALADAGSWEELAYGLVALKKITDDLRILNRAVEDDLARLMPTKRVELEGLGVLERRKGSTRRNWQSEELLERVLRLGIDPEGTGELPGPAELVSRLRSALLAAVPFTGSLGWRVNALKELGLDPSEWCEEIPGRVSVQITDNAQEAGR